MSLALYIAVALVLVVCLAVLVWGVYIDHLRQQRAERCREMRRSLAEGRQIRDEALRPMGRPATTQEAR